MAEFGLSKYLESDIKNKAIDDGKDEILLILIKKGIAYTSELQRNTEHNQEVLNSILARLVNLELIEKIIPAQHPQELFKERLHEFWAMGIYGSERFMQMSWWIPTIKAIDYIKIKYEGQHKPISKALIKYYKLEQN